MGKKRVLFVDDEPNILAGIRRMLRPMRDEFVFHFAESGNEALNVMEQEPIDLIVSDMRMPEMDGAVLLAEVQQRFPHAIRIMLSGQADDESVLRTVSVVHQFLSKPCEPARLRETLVRGSALQDLMGNSHLKDIISGIDTLPSLPLLYTRLQEVLKHPEATADQVAKVIEQDIAMTAKLLQLVNSSFFGLFQKVEDPSRAVKLLGLDTIKILVLGVQIFSEIKADNHSISFDYLWRHSLSVAQCAKTIAMAGTEDKDLINNCFIAGMLHDIGRLLLLTKLNETYEPVIAMAREHEYVLTQAELQAFNATHADIGAYLIGLWGFNGEIVEALAFHHDLEHYPGESFSAAVAVHVADHCYHVRYSGDVIGGVPPLSEAYLARLGLNDQTAEWIDICIAYLDRSEHE